MLCREVAIRLLTPESALNKATVARFLKEAQAIAVIGHPNIVQVIELGYTDEGQAFLVMESLVGKTLYQILRAMNERGEVFTWPQLASIILQVCSALHVAHKQLIAHLDIKPNNIFCCDLDDDIWHIKVHDFGIAKVQGLGSNNSLDTPLTQESIFVGTPHYAAPEIILQRAEHAIDGRVDIFALGVIMYQCLTGTLPFQALQYDYFAVLFKTAHELPESPRQRAPERDIPPEVEAIVLRAMAIRVEDRFASVAELAHAIRGTFYSVSGVSQPSILRGHALIESAPPSVAVYAPETVLAERTLVDGRPPVPGGAGGITEAGLALAKAWAPSDDELSFALKLSDVFSPSALRFLAAFESTSDGGRLAMARDLRRQCQSRLDAWERGVNRQSRRYQQRSMIGASVFGAMVVLTALVSLAHLGVSKMLISLISLTCVILLALVLRR